MDILFSRQSGMNPFQFCDLWIWVDQDDMNVKKTNKAIEY
jgi:hypothetical protein